MNRDFENTVFYHSAADMSEIPDESVRLVVTSPPYFNVKDYSKDGEQLVQHSEVVAADCGSISDYYVYLDSLYEIWLECSRVLVPNGKLCINAPLMPITKKKMDTHHNRHIFNIYSDIEHNIVHDIPEMYLLNVYVWDRPNSSKALMFGSYPYPHNFYSQNSAEFIGVFVKEGAPDKASKEVKEASRLTQIEWREWTKQVWTLAPNLRSDLAYKKHPALMPEEIARRCIKMYSFVDDIVLDPFTGSGTTLKVAKECRRKYVGYEVYEHYSELINAKLASETLAI